MVRPSEQLQQCIDGKKPPSPAFEFWCYRKALELRQMPKREQNKLLKQAPGHIKLEVSKWLK